MKTPLHCHDVFIAQLAENQFDHINYFPEHPLRGKNIPYGPRFPDMSEAYDKELIKEIRPCIAMMSLLPNLPKISLPL